MPCHRTLASRPSEQHLRAKLSGDVEGRAPPPYAGTPTFRDRPSPHHNAGTDSTLARLGCCKTCRGSFSSFPASTSDALARKSRGVVRGARTSSGFFTSSSSCQNVSTAVLQTSHAMSCTQHVCSCLQPDESNRALTISFCCSIGGIGSKSSASLVSCGHIASACLQGDQQQFNREEPARTHTRSSTRPSKC